MPITNQIGYSRKCFIKWTNLTFPNGPEATKYWWNAWAHPSIFLPFQSQMALAMAIANSWFHEIASRKGGGILPLSSARMIADLHPHACMHFDTGRGSMHFDTVSACFAVASSSASLTCAEGLPLTDTGGRMWGRIGAGYGQQNHKNKSKIQEYYFWEKQVPDRNAPVVVEMVLPKSVDFKVLNQPSKMMWWLWSTNWNAENLFLFHTNKINFNEIIKIRP